MISGCKDTKISSDVPAAFPCKLVAVGIFQLLSVINVCVYGVLMPVCVYSTLVPLRHTHTRDFLSPFQLLPTLEVMNFDPAWDDLSLFLLLLEANINQLKSYKCLKVCVCVCVCLCVYAYVWTESLGLTFRGALRC